MAVRYSTGRIPLGFLALSLIVLFGMTGPARADHYLTHPASPAAAGPQSAGGASSQTTLDPTTLEPCELAAKPTVLALPPANLPFNSGAKIAVRRDAKIYIASRNISENDRLLEGYNADRPNRGQFETKISGAVAVPGLLDIARQVVHAQSGGAPDGEYMLTDAMRAAIWRKETAANLWSPTTADDSCATGSIVAAKGALAGGLAAGR